MNLLEFQILLQKDLYPSSLLSSKRMSRPSGIEIVRKKRNESVPYFDIISRGSIVFPIDFRGENKEKMKMAIFMGKYFDSKIHMLVSVSSDKNLLKKTNINLNFAVKYLIQNNIEYEIHEVSKGNFAQQTIDFSQKINCLHKKLNRQAKYLLVPMNMP